MKHCLVFLFVCSLAINCRIIKVILYCWMNMFKSVFSQKHKSPSRSLHVVLNGKSRARFLRNVKSTHDVRNKNEARQRVLN